MTGKIGNRFAAVLAPLALLTLSACAQTFDAKVKRFEAGLPAPSGQTFAIVSDDPALVGGIAWGITKPDHLGIDQAGILAEFDSARECGIIRNNGERLP